MEQAAKKLKVPRCPKCDSNFWMIYPDSASLGLFECPGGDWVLEPSSVDEYRVECGQCCYVPEGDILARIQQCVSYF